MSFPIFIITDVIVPKGLAAFGSIDILHKKHPEKLASQSAFICKMGNSNYKKIDSQELKS